ncbi:MAG: hypothetical protein ABR867_04405, partial [Nitrososphaerales archaeon]
EVRESIRPRFSIRPYALRAYFDTQLLQAEARGLLPESFRVFWMGHHGKIDATYTTSKRRLPDALVQEMRDAFLRAEPYLDFETQRVDPLRQKLQAALPQFTPEAVGKVLRLVERLGGKASRPREW